MLLEVVMLHFMLSNRFSFIINCVTNMNIANVLLVSCKNVLVDNERWYAIRARHKKISIFQIYLENVSNQKVMVDFKNITIQVNETQYNSLTRDEVLKKLKQFTLDALLSPLIFTHWIEYLIEITLLFFGVFYNRTLKKQFLPYLDQQVVLEPQSKQNSYIAFYKLPKSNCTICILVEHSNNESEVIFHNIESS